MRNKDTTNDPTMQNTEIYALMTGGGSDVVSVGTARKLTSTAIITVD
jgi:hypothetical protein